MSVCDDWPNTGSNQSKCWFWRPYIKGAYCDLGLFENAYQHKDEPDTCPYAPILKLLAEAKEVTTDEIKASEWSVSLPIENIDWCEFWIRR